MPFKYNPPSLFFHPFFFYISLFLSHLRKLLHFSFPFDTSMAVLSLSLFSTCFNACAFRPEQASSDFQAEVIRGRRRDLENKKRRRIRKCARILSLFQLLEDEEAFDFKSLLRVTLCHSVLFVRDTF